MKKVLFDQAKLVNKMTALANFSGSPVAKLLNSPNASFHLASRTGKGKVRAFRSAVKSRRITDIELPDIQNFKWIRGTFAFVLNGVKTRERGGKARVCTLILVMGMKRADIPEGFIEIFKKWHGSISEQFYNIDRATDLLLANRSKWPVPQAVVDHITEARPKLQELIGDCKKAVASTELRMRRNALLKTTVGYFLFTVKNWAYGQLIDGTLTIEDVHSLGFLLSGERSGSHPRGAGTLAIAEVKVRVIDENGIMVVVDRSTGENAALVASGWPTDARMALIVIKEADGKEVYRQMTTRLHNEINMGEEARGKLFMIKASFLKHVDDQPHFGNEPTFSMPLTTEDLAAILDQQHHDDFEEHLRAVERHRRDVEQLEAEHAAAKADREGSRTGN
ncbi:MAG: hypothetical protein LBI96_02270 [Odoribacteraceae bacterium]|jgi:hypothetical protein|nr:hypothetical protein [Odoribacteraceae bacterium]